MVSSRIMTKYNDDHEQDYEKLCADDYPHSYVKKSRIYNKISSKVVVDCRELQNTLDSISILILNKIRVSKEQGRIDYLMDDSSIYFKTTYPWYNYCIYYSNSKVYYFTIPGFIICVCSTFNFFQMMGFISLYYILYSNFADDHKHIFYLGFNSILGYICSFNYYFTFYNYLILAIIFIIHTRELFFEKKSNLVTFYDYAIALYNAIIWGPYVIAYETI